MKLFGQLVRTIVNTAMLPVAVVKDACTLGGVAVDEEKPFTLQQLEKIKREASENE